MFLTNYRLLYQNETYDFFVIVLVRPEMIGKAPVLFYSILIIEVFNLALSVCLFLPIVFAMNKFYTYHKNFIRLAQIYLVSYYLDVASRLTTMAYSTGFLKFAGSLPEDLPLFFASTGRIIFTAQYCLLIPAMLSERAFATYFLEDYELRTRRWTTALIYGISFGYSVFGAYKIAIGELNFSHLIGLSALVVFGIVIFVVFHRYNSKKLFDLSSHYRSTNKYTLTVRYQVTENLKVLKNILIMSVIMLFFLVVAGIITLFAVFKYDLFTFEGQLCSAVLELWIAFSANTVTISLFILNKSWNNTTIRHLFCLRNNSRVTSIDKPHQTDVYFSMLTKQW